MMPKFRVTVRFVDLMGPDVLAVRQELEDRLRVAGTGAWRIVEVAPAHAQPAAEYEGVARRRADRDLAGKLMLMGAAAWALWFFWALVE